MTNERVVTAYATVNGYVGQFDYDEDLCDQSSVSKLCNGEFQTVIILDRSGSMGRHVKRFLNCILPHTLELLGYGTEDPVDLIMFDNQQTHDE